VLAALVALVVVCTALGLVLLWPGEVASRTAPDVGERVKGDVTAVSETPCSQSLPDLDVPPGGEDEFASADEGLVCSRVSVRVAEGPDSGEVVTFVAGDELAQDVRVGRGVVLLRAPGDVPLASRYQIADTQRGGALLLLAGLFAIAVVALGRWRGLTALAGLAASLGVLVVFLVPALLAGQPPVPTAVVGASAVMLLVLGLTHGVSVRTATALVGTAASLALILGLSVAFVELAGLTGATSEEAAYVRATFDDVDVRGLLLAGIVIGALGILDDVTVTQVSTVWELRRAAPELPSREVYAAALRVGRDHIASTVNTLLLAYAGASLPLLVVFTTSGQGLVDTLTNGVIGEEVVRTLAGSIGLVAAVPITTALAAWTAAPVVGPAEPKPGQGVPGAPTLGPRP
jgi:uncharacterized membrane protein